jgi:hypothetical protein
MDVECGMYGGGRGAYRALVLKHEGKKRLGRPRRKCETNIKVISKNRKKV